MPEVKPAIETFAKIKVVGVGGAGGSAINRMVQAKIRGVEFVALNTDIQAIHHSLASEKLNIGKSVTRGLGAGMDPETGRRAAEESQNEIRDILKGANMVFITCGLGGGTGSGAAPIIAEIAREMGALTVAVVTKPFVFEGEQRKSIADRAHEELAQRVDTIITIPNDRVLQMIDKKTTLMESFRIIDDVLRQAVQGISELITSHGQINVDFADVKAIMTSQGPALMGIGRGSGENRAIEAAKAAIASPLLELSIDGARGILFIITGSDGLGMQEVQEAAKIITGSADDNAKIIFGVVTDDSLKDEIKITVIATGFEDRSERLANQSEDRPAFRVNRPLHTPATVTPAPHFSRVAPITSIAPGEDADDTGRQPQPTRIVPQPIRPVPKEQESSVSPQSFQKKQLSTSQNEDLDEEELEIPAFIRKKMGGNS